LEAVVWTTRLLYIAFIVFQQFHSSCRLRTSWTNLKRIKS